MRRVDTERACSQTASRSGRAASCHCHSLVNAVVRSAQAGGPPTPAKGGTVARDGGASVVGIFATTIRNRALLSLELAFAAFNLRLALFFDHYFFITNCCALSCPERCDVREFHYIYHISVNGIGAFVFSQPCVFTVILNKPFVIVASPVIVAHAAKRAKGFSKYCAGTPDGKDRRVFGKLWVLAGPFKSVICYFKVCVAIFTYQHLTEPVFNFNRSAA